MSPVLRLFLVVVWLLAAFAGGGRAEGLLGAAPANPQPVTKQPRTVVAPPPAPGSPTALVRPFYEHPGLELDPGQRGNFIDPARTVLDEAEALRESGQGECLDPNMALDNADYDQAAIEKSLKTMAAVKGDEAKVVVAFVVAGAPHRLEWKLKKIGGAWRISDLLSVTGEWALSQYQCE